MTRLLLRAGSAIALCFAGPAFAQQAAPKPAPVESTAPAAQQAKPGLWVVKDEDTTIYLFGTVHVLKPNVSWFDGTVKQAFDASGEVVTELGVVDPAAMQPVMLKYGFNATGPGLSERLPEDKRAVFLKALADNSLPQQVVDRFKPWLAAVQLSMLSLVKAGYAPQSGAEEVIHSAAKAAGKPVSGLETVEEQFGFFASLSDDAQLVYLTETLDKMDSAVGEFDKIVAKWAEGDAEGLGALMNESLASSPELAKVLLADRNARWADWIKTRLDKPGVVFVAVGAGHLAGNDSVQLMLKERKIETQRVAN